MPPYLPAPHWSAGNEAIAHRLHPIIQTWRTEANGFPAAWGEGHLTFLPKPGKPSRTPADLRPIALLDPIIAGTMRAEAWSLLPRLPQFAYLPDRGRLDAIQRLRIHCREVKQLMQQYSHPIHRHASGATTPSLLGGALISLDLRKAFDRVSRHKLVECFQRIGVCHNLALLIQHLYQNTSYTFHHRGQTRHIKTERGIRQGCKAAPAYWTAYIAGIILTLESQTSIQWVAGHLTAFADDICAHGTFTSPEGLAEILWNPS